MQARAHALCRDASASRTTVLEAERHYERFRADGEPAWLSFRSRCFVQTDLAAAYLIEGEHEHAAALTRDALNTARQVSSGRAVSHIRALQQQIRPPHSVGLSELDEEITDFLRRAHDDEDIPT